MSPHPRRRTDRSPSRARRSVACAAAAAGCVALLLPGQPAAAGPTTSYRSHSPHPSGSPAAPHPHAAAAPSASGGAHHPLATSPATAAPTPNAHPSARPTITATAQASARPTTPATPTPTSATPTTTAPAAARALSIEVPAGLHLVAVPGHSRLYRAELAGVTVTATGAAGSAVGWTATVTASGFRVRNGKHWAPARGTRVTYTSGAATAKPAGVACVPGQVGTAAADLRSARTAFSCTGRSRASAAVVSWDATVTVGVGADSPAGAYAGTIVHSVY